MSLRTVQIDELLKSASDNLREIVLSLDDNWDLCSDVWLLALKQVGVKRLVASFLNLILFAEAILSKTLVWIKIENDLGG